MGISLHPSHLKRYKDIAWLFIKFGRSDLINNSEIDVTSDAPAGATNDRPMAEELANDLEKMGPTFIKIGQLLSTRSDLLPVPYIEALTRLQDKVEPFPFADVEKIIVSELGTRLFNAFAVIDPIPLAAASLGQVHRAVLRDGREVAVKIQRPGIRESMLEDLDSLAEISGFLDQHTHVGKRYETQRILAEFRRTLLRELDYREEAQNLVTLGTNLREFSGIVVPQPIEDYTTSRVLTMEFINGHKLSAVTPELRAEFDGPALAELLFKAYLKQILVDGFYHADPHPGNALLTEDGSIALLDLGMVARIAPHMQESMLQILIAISEGRGEDVASTLISISEKKKDFNERAVVRSITESVARHNEMSLQNMALGKIVMEVAMMAADSGIRTPPECTTLGKTLLNLDMLGRAFDPNFNPNESVRRNAASIMRRKLTGSLTPGNIFSGVMEAKDFATRLPGRVNKILDAVANNELAFRVNAIDEAKLLTGFQKVANRITVGLILAALIIGAALLARVDSTFRFLGYPVLATIFFLMAAIGGIILMIRILFYDESE